MVGVGQQRERLAATAKSAIVLALFAWLATWVVARYAD